MRAGIAHRRVDSFEDTVAVGGYYERRTRAFFYIGFALIFINRVIAQIATNLNLGFLEELPLMPVALCILFIRYAGLMFGASARRVGLSLLFLFLSFVSFIKSGQSYLPTACLLLCGVGEVNIRKVIEVTSICALLLIAALGLVQAIDWMTTGNIVGSAVRSSGRLRLSFFFAHPNTLAAIGCMACIGLTACRSKIKVGEALFILATGALIILITDSRTSFAILLIYMALRLLLQRERFALGGKALIAFGALPVFFEIIALVASLNLLPGSMHSYLNALFNGRPGYWNLQYKQLGFSLFGQTTMYGDQLINDWLYPSVTIDCYYAATLLQIGVWSFLVFLFLYMRSGIQAVKDGDCFKYCALISCALFGFTEIHMIDFAISFPMLLLGEGLFCISSSPRCR